MRRSVSRLNSVHDRPARLAKIKRVGEVWQEYLHGIGGNKPAKDFTGPERNATGGTYSRRKPIYDMLAELVRAGHTAPAAIRAIDDTYPGVSLLRLAKWIAADKKNNTLHQRLQI
jgi:hypothetical protein